MDTAGCPCVTVPKIFISPDNSLSLATEGWHYRLSAEERELPDAIRCHTFSFAIQNILTPPLDATLPYFHFGSLVEVAVLLCRLCSLLGFLGQVLIALILQATSHT